MKQFELWAKEYSEKFNKRMLWDTYILVSDAWIKGFQKSREECSKMLLQTEGVNGCCSSVGETLIEVEVQSNQIGEGVPKLNKETFKKQMEMCYNVTNLNVHESENGSLSFQGIIKL